MPTLEQRRAAFALAKVEGIKTSSDKAKYKTQLLKLPARLHSNGLGQTVAFYLSAGPGKPETIICDWLQTWLAGDETEKIYPAQALVKSLAGIGLGKDVDAEARYRTASTEARALAVWLKRFAEAFIEGDKA